MCQTELKPYGSCSLELLDIAFHDRTMWYMQLLRVLMHASCRFVMRLCSIATDLFS